MTSLSNVPSSKFPWCLLITLTAGKERLGKIWTRGGKPEKENGSSRVHAAGLPFMLSQQTPAITDEVCLLTGQAKMKALKLFSKRGSARMSN